MPAFYANLMSDIDVHIVRSAVTASGTTVGLTGLYHRQLHGTGQGTVEGPINWILIAGIVMSVVRQRSKQPVALPSGDGKRYTFVKAWFVGDLGLGQAGEGSTGALQDATDGSGLVYYFIGLERRGSKCLLSKFRWVAGELVRRAMGVDRTGERDNTAARQRLQADWAETKRRLGTQGRNAKRQLIPGWVVVAMLPLCKLKRQLAAWKRV